MEKMDIQSDWQSGKELKRSIQLMYENEISTDVTFAFLGNIKLKAHKFILIARSHVFFTMFNSDLHKPGDEIAIKDVEPEVFSEFLRFLYFEEAKLNRTDILELIYCAEKYAISALKSTGLTFLKENIDKTNVALFLDQAVLYDNDSLKQACLEFFSKHKTLGFLKDHHVSRETLEVIVDYEELAVKIADIIKAVDNWAEEECKKKSLETTPENKQGVLGPVRNKIPFCSMTAEELQDSSVQDLINKMEELEIYKFVSSAGKIGPSPFPCRQQVLAPTYVPIPRIVKPTKGKAFYLSLTCTVGFTLKGLVFAEAGIYTIYLNREQELFRVTEPDSKLNLHKPILCQFQNSLSIGDNNYLDHKGSHEYTVKLDESKHRNVEFEMRTCSSGSVPKYAVYLGAPDRTAVEMCSPPFTGLIVEFE